jgi:hypothetical protein
MASVALLGASATLLALLILALRPVQDHDIAPAMIEDVVIVRVLTRCHWCLARDLVRVPTTMFCADCSKPVCGTHASGCAFCGRTSCAACYETWSGVDGVVCVECQRRVS